MSVLLVKVVRALIKWLVIEEHWCFGLFRLSKYRFSLLVNVMIQAFVGL